MLSNLAVHCKLTLRLHLNYVCVRLIKFAHNFLSLHAPFLKLCVNLVKFVTSAFLKLRPSFLSLKAFHKFCMQFF